MAVFGMMMPEGRRRESAQSVMSCCCSETRERTSGAGILLPPPFRRFLAGLPDAADQHRDREMTALLDHCDHENIAGQVLPLEATGKMVQLAVPAVRFEQNFRAEGSQLFGQNRKCRGREVMDVDSRP